MTIRLNPRYLLIFALLLSFSFCRAQSVPPTVTYSFGTTNDGTQMWDLTGDYALNVVVTKKNGVQVPLTVDFHMIQDPIGNLHGVIGDPRGLSLGESANFTVFYSINGKVTGSGGTAQARFVVRFFGGGTVGSLQQNVSISAVLEVLANPNSVDGQLDAIVPAKFAAHLGGGLEGVNGTIALEDFVAPLPPGVDGSWTLNLQMLGGNSLDGSAILTTDAGQGLGFKVSGPVNGTTAIARLRGSGGIAGATISGAGSFITISPDDLTFGSGLLSGKIMGQKFQQIPLPPPD